ncbi:type II toxin-antitoxin system VapC family toxin [Brevundimonas sp. AJA228-03]|uniref:type II toxin-antitoxin system VapC family toxin n=1 Tax=Brevundimonas sp. AJA228-03 TaxID=2752515 RepID=UPI001AE0C919|nr:type II toxin-antitoxin system VapC family toxin [Brevundimonas sp. AJA228-03]QTN19127.1 type II toxin-antitoxin system VapC family toxin [Brevundimonas sp. AJA228-03]
MVIDTSALIAIIQNEPEARAFDASIRTSSTRLISTATVLEIVSVLTRRLGYDARPIIDHLRADYRLVVVGVDQDQMTVACEAMVRFGRSRHPAALNFGDCFAYALSKTSGEPLLFKGDDFSRTDIRAA